MGSDLLDDVELQPRINSGNDRLIKILLVVLPTVMLGAFVYSAAEIESILASGPITAILSIFLFVIAIIRRKTLSVITGSFGLFSVFLVLGTIVGFGLSPAEAKKPIPWLILICTFIVVFLAFFSWYKDFKSSQLEVRENDGNY